MGIYVGVDFKARQPTFVLLLNRITKDEPLTFCRTCINTMLVAVQNFQTMTVNEFIKKLEQLQPKLREKEIVIECPNGLIVEPSVKMLLEDKWNLFGGVENVKSMIVTWQ